MTLTYVGALCLIPKWAMAGFGRDAVALEAHTLVERITAFVCTALVVGPVVVRGSENLPPEEDGGGGVAPQRRRQRQ